GTAIRMIEEKAERYGKTVVKIGRWFPSSKTCSDCGHIVEKLPLNARKWTWPECGATHDRDANAAINNLAAGHAVTAHGDGVRAAPLYRAESQLSEKCEPTGRSIGAAGITALQGGEDVKHG